MEEEVQKVEEEGCLQERYVQCLCIKCIFQNVQFFIRQKVQEEEGQKVARKQEEGWKVQQKEEVWSQKVHQKEELGWKETQIGQIWQKVKEGQEAQEGNGKG